MKVKCEKCGQEKPQRIMYEGSICIDCLDVSYQYKFRVKNRLQQGEIADEAGVSRHTVRAFETDGDRVSVGIARRICAALGITLNDMT